ncbi:tetratricopeptide repeat protein [Xanthobacter sediminis]
MAQIGTDIAQSLFAARRFMSERRLDAADLLIDDVLTVAPADVNALGLRAVSLLARGEGERAFELLSVLVGNHPERADLVGHLGAAHRLAGRTEEARFCLERAVALDPQDGTHRGTLATLLVAAGDLAEARVQIAALLDLGRRQQSPEVVAQGHALSARVALLERAPLAAESALRKALALRPDDAADLALLSDVLARLHRRDEALDLARQLYVKAPTDHGGATLLARRLMDMNRLDEAEHHLRRIVATAPHHVDGNHLLAICLAVKGQGARALAQFGALVRRAPSDAEMQVRMATLMRVSGDLDKALAFARIAAQQPLEPAQALRDELLLALGRLGEVWPVPPEVPAPAAVTVPLGTPASEVVLFARFAAGLAPAGGRIVCHGEPDLLPLLAGVVGLAPTAEPATPGAVALSDLPAVLGIGAEGPPTAPYLAVEAARNDAWQQALRDFPRPLVGLVWDEAAPGLTLDAIVGALGERPAQTGTFVSLVFDERRRQLATHPAIVDAGAQFADSRDLAAAVAQLDLTVGADGLALHVAGALGREGVVAVPPHLPWAWAHREGRSLWYPTLRVARQPVPGNWVQALAEVRSTVQPDMVRDGAAPEGGASQDGAPAGAVQEGVAPDRTTPDRTSPQGAVHEGGVREAVMQEGEG